MVRAASQWVFDVHRGPDWLFVRITPPDKLAKGPLKLAEGLWSILSKHFTYRLVLEMHEIERLPSELIGELAALQKRIEMHGGTLRLCGLSEICQEALNKCRLSGRLRNYSSRAEAVLGPHCVVVGSRER
jgi:anti-anti-sigma regulatory factor